MRDWRSLFKSKRPDASADPTSNTTQVHWLPPEENPFGVEILDCRNYALNMVSVTSNPGVARQFSVSRTSTGKEYSGQLPKDSRRVDCDLAITLIQRPNDGPLFKAKEMEDKWDIYLFDNHLYFARSWTGDLVFRAAILFEGGRGRITAIETSQTNDEFAVQQVDFLIKSHILEVTSLHPLPKDMKSEAPLKLAVLSFSLFGRRGLYGTFENTLLTKTYAAG